MCKNGCSPLLYIIVISLEQILTEQDGSFEQSKHMFKLVGKKIITILRS